MLTTIYKATCNVTGKSYIGQSKHGLALRRRQHTSTAKRGYGRCRAFNAALRKHGEDAFKWSVIARVPPEWANAAEEVAIVQHGTLAPNGYNLREGGNVSGFSEETRAKISASRKGKSPSAKTRAKLSASLKATHAANPMSEDTRKKMSASRKGKPWSAARRAAQNNKTA